jgi:hypothetical protein
MEDVVPNRVRPIRYVRFDNDTDRIAERPTLSSTDSRFRGHPRSRQCRHWVYIMFLPTQEAHNRQDQALRLEKMSEIGQVPNWYVPKFTEWRALRWSNHRSSVGVFW